MNAELKKEIGKYFVDVSKLVMGGVVLSSVLKIEGLSNVLVILAGGTITIMFAVLGFILMNIKKNN